MARERVPEIEIPGSHSVMGSPRRLTLTPSVTGKVALTVYVGGKPVTVVAPIGALAVELAKLPR